MNISNISSSPTQNTRSEQPKIIYEYKYQFKENIYKTLVNELIKTVPNIPKKHEKYDWLQIRSHIKHTLGLDCTENVLLNAYKIYREIEIIAPLALEKINHFRCDWPEIVKELKKQNNKSKVTANTLENWYKLRGISYEISKITSTATNVLPVSQKQGIDSVSSTIVILNKEPDNTHITGSDSTNYTTGHRNSNSLPIHSHNITLPLTKTLTATPSIEPLSNSSTTFNQITPTAFQRSPFQELTTTRAPDIGVQQIQNSFFQKATTPHSSISNSSTSQFKAPIQEIQTNQLKNIYSHKEQLKEVLFRTLENELIKCVPNFTDDSGNYEWNKIRNHIKSTLGLDCEEVLLKSCYSVYMEIEKIAPHVIKIIKVCKLHWPNIIREIKRQYNESHITERTLQNWYQARGNTYSIPKITSTADTFTINQKQILNNETRIIEKTNKELDYALYGKSSQPIYCQNLEHIQIFETQTPLTATSTKTTIDTSRSSSSNPNQETPTLLDINFFEVDNARWMLEQEIEGPSECLNTPNFSLSQLSKTISNEDFFQNSPSEEPCGSHLEHIDLPILIDQPDDSTLENTIEETLSKIPNKKRRKKNAKLTPKIQKIIIELKKNNPKYSFQDITDIINESEKPEPNLTLSAIYRFYQQFQSQSIQNLPLPETRPSTTLDLQPILNSTPSDSSTELSEGSIQEQEFISLEAFLPPEEILELSKTFSKNAANEIIN